MKNLIKASGGRYVLMGMWYMAIAMLLIALMLSVCLGVHLSMVYKNKKLLLMFLGIYFALAILPIVRGGYIEYRTDQTFALFTAFIFMLLYQTWAIKKSKTAQTAVIVLLGFLCFKQAMLLNKLSVLNYQRSEEEANVVRTIRYELEYINAEKKPVIFVGQYDMSSAIIDEISVDPNGIRWKLALRCFKLFGFSPEGMNKKYVRTNVSSILGWSITSFENQAMMVNLFQYYGFDIVPVRENFKDAYSKRKKSRRMR